MLLQPWTVKYLCFEFVGLCRQDNFPRAARPVGVLELFACPCHTVHALVYAFWPCYLPRFRVRIIICPSNPAQWDC